VAPQRATLHVLAEALGCLVEDLLNDEDPAATGSFATTSAKQGRRASD